MRRDPSASRPREREEILDLQLTDIALSGESYAEVQGATIYVDGGIPGEKVRVRIVARGQADALDRGDDGVAKAALVAVLEPSPHRVKPACPHASACGGCSFQHVAYEEQLRQKTHLLDGLLEDTFGAGKPLISPMIGMRVDEQGVPRHFRQKAAFSFVEDDRGRLQIGHFARGTHTVVPVTECLVHSDRANRVAFAIKDAMAKKRVPVATVRGGLLRHVVVRVTEDETEAVAVVVATEEHRVLESPLRAISGSRDKPQGLLLNLHDQASPYLFGPHTVRVDGLGHVKETALGPSFLSSPTGFFQTNIHGAGHLIRLVKDAIGSADSLKVLDLYSGSGLFALPLALAKHRVTAVEESRKASREAAKNARLSGIPESRLRLMPSKVEDAIEHLARQDWDAVVIDPPRSGCPEDVMRTLTRKIAPPKLVIVSCNPETLMDEMRLATDAGYRATLVQPIDMFPHTPHIETVVVLELKHRARTVARTERSTTHLAARHKRPARPKPAERLAPERLQKKRAALHPAKPWSRMPKPPSEKKG
ncbi:MAG: 23S rRNA (uracil(1939)-C(5))-methyltransferase RlmD [Vicinamibacteria bacterium]|nr:23S rRNA (uracil(1939)-C(5))-methyltransferase RlmD [Vicinamibacteria bacterium]